MDRRSPGPDNKQKPSRVAAWLGLSALVHGVLVLAFLHTQLGDPHARPGPAAASTGAAAVDVDPSCLLEETLTALARASLCLPPSLADRDACLDRAFERFELARLACVNVNAPIELTMMDVATPPKAP